MVLVDCKLRGVLEDTETSKQECRYQMRGIQYVKKR